MFQTFTYVWFLAFLIPFILSMRGFYKIYRIHERGKKFKRKSLTIPSVMLMISILVITNPPFKHGVERNVIRTFDQQPKEVREIEKIRSERYSPSDNQEDIDRILTTEE